MQLGVRIRGRIVVFASRPHGVLVEVESIHFGIADLLSNRLVAGLEDGLYCQATVESISLPLWKSTRLRSLKVFVKRSPGASYASASTSLGALSAPRAISSSKICELIFAVMVAFVKTGSIPERELCRGCAH